MKARVEAQDFGERDEKTVGALPGDRSARRVELDLERVRPHIGGRAEPAVSVIRGARVAVAGAHFHGLRRQGQGRSGGGERRLHHLGGDDFAAHRGVETTRRGIDAQGNQPIESPLAQFSFEELHIRLGRVASEARFEIREGGGLGGEAAHI